jgi:hypothetical protein
LQKRNKFVITHPTDKNVTALTTSTPKAATLLGAIHGVEFARTGHAIVLTFTDRLTQFVLKLLFGAYSLCVSKSLFLKWLHYARLYT